MLLLTPLTPHPDSPAHSRPFYPAIPPPVTAVLLKFQLHTDKPPSFGYWIAQGATTLFEYWGNAAYSTPNLLNSYNHM